MILWKGEFDGGGAFGSGRDATYDWVTPDITLPNFVARSLGSNGEPVPITNADRKILQKNLRKLVPGTTVKRNGQISVPRAAGQSASYRLIRGIASTGRNVSIVVNHSGDVSTLPVKSNGQPNSEVGLYGGVSDSIVNWDPDAQFSAEERVSPETVVTVKSPSEIQLAHELIHAYNLARGEQTHFLEFGFHSFPAGGWVYEEAARARELRVLGYGYNVDGDITENQIRRQLGYRSRAAYALQSNWIPICNLDPHSSAAC